jgi:hypothetical protein
MSTQPNMFRPDSKTPNLIGLTEAAALTAHPSARVVKRDGESFPLTMDFNPNRMNLEVTNGVVVAVSRG